MKAEQEKETLRVRRRQSGYTLIEMLFVGLIATVLGAGLWTLLRSTYDSQYELLGQNTANANARAAVDELADKLRGAKALSAATSTSLTFTDNSNNSIRYWLTGGKLVKSTNGSPSAGDTVVRDVQTVTFVYWTNSGGSWTSSSAPTTPANVAAVDFSVTGTKNGCTRQVSGSVRIRQK
jgi:type II secretory pathway pseudopilin PulG